jgi:ABC-2 type transport system permease protein
MIQPVLWVVFFGVGMRSMIGGGAAGPGPTYLGFMLPGIVALSAMGGAIGGGMAWLDERIRGIVKGYLVAPVPRISILLGNVGSTVTKALIQALVILVVGLVMGAAMTADTVGWLLGFALLVGYATGFAGLALALASKTDNLMAYHAMIMLLNLPVLFLSNSLYPMASLPEWMRVGAMANPASYFVDGIRQTVLGAPGELQLWLCLTVTACFAMLGLLAASRAFAAKTARS